MTTPFERLQNRRFRFTTPQTPLSGKHGWRALKESLLRKNKSERIRLRNNRFGSEIEPEAMTVYLNTKNSI